MFKLKPSLGLIEKYKAQVVDERIRENPQQQHILSILEECWQDEGRFVLPWKRHTLKNNHVYIYGTVGSGKTYIMDMFYESIPSTLKLRIHFHAFLEQVSQELKCLQGVANPMKHLVKRLAKAYRVICLDEMMVQDVVQAMLLVELIPALMKAQVMLVMTSNIEPSKLYLNGLQRERFMKVIGAIEEHCHVLSLSSHLDYRSQHIPRPECTYFYPLNAPNEVRIKQLYTDFAGHLQEEIQWNVMVNIQNRDVPVVAVSHDLIWFEFKNISQIPRCQRDYLELSQKYKTIFVSGLSQFTEDDISSLILWMYFIDVCYDSHIKLMILSAVDIEELYPSGPMQEVFARTLSRMKEMQSEWYWQT